MARVLPLPSPSRRSVLAGLGATLAAGRPASAGKAAAAVFLSACDMPDGGHRVAAFTGDGSLIYTTELPARGHDVAVRPGHAAAVVFARRPGDWFAVFDVRSGIARHVVRAAPGRHFYGHGVFSQDGRLLFATENDIASGRGVLGLYDADAGYRRVDERPSHGIGPHDVALIPGGLMAIANGGLRTEPAQGRRILNGDDPQPRLTLVEAATGRLCDEVDLGPASRRLSIRHLAVTPDGAVAFGCQHLGDPEDMPSLVGVRRTDGRVVMLDMPEEDLAALDGYVGSVALDASGRILCATSPRGGAAVFWDLASGRYLGRRSKPDVSGVAAGGGAGVFLVTSGNDGAQMLALDGTATRRLPAALSAFMWDNHVERLPPAS